MEPHIIKDMQITLDKKGSGRYQKVSYPMRFGTYSIIETPEYTYHLNLNGQIKFIQAKNDKYWSKDEWIKRTDGNDWIYYTPGIYTGLKSFIGEYYLPCFSFKSNSIFAYDPFVNSNVKNTINSIDKLCSDLSEDLKLKMNIPPEIENFLQLASRNNLNHLKAKAEIFHNITGGRASVLPPDSRHVDYDVIPINIADGCLYKCKFCMVKNMLPFKPQSKDNILNQIEELKSYYGQNISNYNSIFMGQHDALGAGREKIVFTAERAFEAFNFKNSYMQGSCIFLFASVDSFLNAEDNLFAALNSLPSYTYINIGLESADGKSLEILEKPITVESVNDSFSRMFDINKRYENIEITANFILSSKLPKGHYPSIINLINSRQESFYGKGAVYLSPFPKNENKVKLQKDFFKIKNELRVPAFTYLIQRL